MDSAALTLEVKTEARRLGFDWARVVPLGESAHAGFYSGWVQAGRAGEMEYLTRNQDRRRFPALLAEDGQQLRSMVVLAVNYYQFALPQAILNDPSRGIIASYAWGDDYHEIIRPHLYALDALIAARSGRTSHGKCLVDTGPVLERDWAHFSGLGFTGKNCCTIRPGAGSWLFLATVMVPEELEADIGSLPAGPYHSTPQPEAVMQGLPAAELVGTWEIPLSSSDAGFRDGATASGTCGRCTRCLDACPTDAFIGPFHLDPLRCISYWTIEARSAIPRHLRGKMGNRIFGCDICQEVCPWNLHLEPRKPLLEGLCAQSRRMAPPLLEGFAPESPYWLEQDAFSVRFRRSPIKRAKRAGMLRNVCVSLGNWASPTAIGALARALGETEPLVRIHAAWALGEVLRNHGAEDARVILEETHAGETDEDVRQELRLALAGNE